MTNKKPTVEEMIPDLACDFTCKIQSVFSRGLDKQKLQKFKSGQAAEWVFKEIHNGINGLLEEIAQAAREEERQELIIWICKRLNCTPEQLNHAAHPGKSESDDRELGHILWHLINNLTNNHDHITTNS